MTDKKKTTPEDIAGAKSRDDVRERLMDAAEVLFCQKGFDQTSVRDLTIEADCNVASVNYYFGGKTQLYTEMFQRRFSQVIQGCMQAVETTMAGPHPTLEELIRGWVTPPLKALEQQEPLAMIMRLMVREFLNQKIDPEPFVADMKRLFIDRLSQVFQQLEPGLSASRSVLAVFSVEAILIHPLLFIDYYMGLSTAQDMNIIIDHLVGFGAAAIRGIAKDGVHDSE